MPKPGSEPRPASDILADRLVKVAELRYFERLSRKEIAAKLSAGRSEQFNESNVNHWLDDARSLGVVAIDIDRSFAFAGKANRRASERLMRAFALEQALVVDVGSESQADKKAADLHSARKSYRHEPQW